jgi:hypothetical protein
MVPANEYLPTRPVANHLGVDELIPYPDITEMYQEVSRCNHFLYVTVQALRKVIRALAPSLYFFVVKGACQI